MSDLLRLHVNGREVRVEPGTSVAAAVLRAGCDGFRRSVMGEWRGPVCGMGICFECRVTLNGCAHVRSCQVKCEDGMRVETA